MSATLSGAIKAQVESASLGLPVFRDRPPSGQPLPYAVVHEGIGRTMERAGDFGDATKTPEHREECQLDVFQAARALATGTTAEGRAESYSLVPAVIKALHGRTVQNVNGGRVYPLVVNGCTRAPDLRANVIRDTISIIALRQTT